MKTQILFAAFEAEPFAKTGGLGDVAGSLPPAIAGEDIDIRVILPKFSSIPAVYQEKMEYITDFTVPLGWRNQYCGLFSLEHKGITFFFLDNEYYFHRDRLYGDFDDGERVAFFSKAILESIRYLPDFAPQILHCNDWHTALAPVYLHEHYHHLPEYENIKTVFTIHNLKFQGKYDPFILGDVLGLWETPAASQLTQGDCVNYLQGGAIYCDKLTTVSPTYAEEICTPYYGEGLDWLFRRRKDSLSGILNGIDLAAYDPATDSDIPHPFDLEHLEDKIENKLALQRELGLEVDAEIPLFVLISRLTEQKGMDLLVSILPEVSQRRMQLVVLGVGEESYEAALRYWAGECPDRISAKLLFDTATSKRIYAGADCLLMPSRFEPCGLSQMMAMRYGTLPLVRETGGLKDSVEAYNQYTGEGTGFRFSNFDSFDFLGAIDRALTVWYKRRDHWFGMQKAAMEKDFSWDASAQQYRALYASLLE